MQDKKHEEIIEKMWKARVVNYPPGASSDDAYKEGWEQGYRFAINTHTQSLMEKVENGDKIIEDGITDEAWIKVDDVLSLLRGED